MGRTLRIVWMIIVPIVVFGGGYFVFTTQAITIATGVFWGICIVLNLPMSIAMYMDDMDDSDRNFIAYFIWVVILAPLWLIWQWILALIYLRN